MIIKNNLIPFKGFTAMAIMPFIFVRKDWIERDDWLGLAYRYDIVLNHEKIHLAQQLEVFWIGCGITLLSCIILGFSGWFLPIPFVLYYVLYCVDWLLGVVSGEKHPYSKICFKKEAYDNEHNQKYLESRKMFSWIKYI
jgi:hypothetical protein